MNAQTLKRAKHKIKKGDRVIVIAGKYKGKTGEVQIVYPDDRVLVAGVNLVKKHKRGNPQAGEPGGVIDKEAPLNISNVAIFNSQTEKADRIGYKRLADGRKVRYFKSTGEVVDL